MLGIIIGVCPVIIPSEPHGKWIYGKRSRKFASMGVNQINVNVTNLTPHYGRCGADV